MKEITSEYNKSSGLTRRLSTRKHFSGNTKIVVEAVDSESMTDSLLIAGYILMLASVTVLAFVS